MEVRRRKAEQSRKSPHLLLVPLKNIECCDFSRGDEKQSKAEKKWRRRRKRKEKRGPEDFVWLQARGGNVAQMEERCTPLLTTINSQLKKIPLTSHRHCKTLTR
nr:MAG: hypothetical protein [Sesarmops intermedium nimavirus]